VAIFFTITLYPSLIVKEQSYKIGDIADKDIKAQREFFIEDKDATEARRKEAMENVVTVYDYHTSLFNTISNNISGAFKEIRMLTESEKIKMDSNMDFKSRAELQKLSVEDVIAETTQTQTQTLLNRKAIFEKKIGIPVSKGAYKILEKENFSVNIEDLIIRIIQEILENGVVKNKEILLRETGKGILLKYSGADSEMLVKGLRKIYGPDQAKTMVRIIGQPLLKNSSYSLRNLIVDFAQRLIRPNISLNYIETNKRKKKAASEVKPILYKVKAGEMILREGERITKDHMAKLRNLQVETKKGKLFSNSLGAGMILVFLFTITYIITLNHNSKITINHNRDLLFITSLFIIFFLITVISSSVAESLAMHAPFPISGSSILFGIPIASSAMIACMFIGYNNAIFLAIVFSICTAFVFPNKFELLIYFLLSSAMAAYWAQHCRERKVLIKAGVKLGVLNMALVAVLDLYLGECFKFGFVWDLVFAFIGGIGAAAVTTGIAPLFEMAFDYMSDIKMLELANLDKPILRRLMIEAPGTYHHSVIVGSMVEAAAAEIGVNPLAAKVCGYYHDIGKLKKPLYFIENQANGKNKHDKLAPSMSSLILISHIKDGVELAKKNKLGDIIINAIQQHHGTSLISYFYGKARKIKGDDSVTIDDFRYPGPKPQTWMAGLVMLADVVEAASRTLENPTPSRIQWHVQTTINRIFAEGELDECDLTLKNLHKIAKSFNKILNGIHHHRIEYPEKKQAANGNGNNGGSDKKQTEFLQNTSARDNTEGSGNLKRLGLS
ncbi:MAG: HDIG domain-containing protein, partial [Deltaproteobacteria bacterium]|nr:HDIG domain-containing protein [Deltaproteobacteria bacterium]